MATVDEIIEDAQSYANDAVAQVNSFLSILENLALETFSVDLPDIWSYSVFDRTDEALRRIQSSQPAAQPYPSIALTLPNDPNITIEELAELIVPEFTADKPVMAYPLTPDTGLPDTPTAPEYSPPSMPSRPYLSLPRSPNISGVSIPTPPSIEMPLFSAQAPIDDLVAPSNTFTFAEQDYSSALMDAANSKILNDIQNGGYGIDTVDEQALWERARDRELVNSQTVLDEAKRQFASLGHSMPPGALAAALKAATMKAQNANSTINRDVALKKADLYVENRRFTIEKALHLEGILINYHNAVMERALNSARVVLQAGIDVFNSEVLRFNVKLDVYRTAAQVYESKIRAGLAQADIYRTQLEGVKAEVDVQNSQVNLYKAEIAGVNAVVDIYKTEMEATNLMFGVEKIRLDSFRAEVDAYRARVQAKVAEFGMYEAGVKGEVAKVDAYSAEVKAYSAEIDGVKAKSEIENGKLRARTERARILIDKYRADITAKMSELEGAVQQANATTGMYKARVGSWGLLTGAITEVAKLGTTTGELNARTNIESVKLSLEKAKIVLEQFVTSSELRQGAAKAGAEVYRNLASGALSSINALASKNETVETTTEE